MTQLETNIVEVLKDNVTPMAVRDIAIFVSATKPEIVKALNNLRSQRLAAADAQASGLARWHLTAEATKETIEVAWENRTWKARRVTSWDVVEIRLPDGTAYYLMLATGIGRPRGRKARKLTEKEQERLRLETDAALKARAEADSLDAD